MYLNTKMAMLGYGLCSKLPTARGTYITEVHHYKVVYVEKIEIEGIDRTIFRLYFKP